MNIDYLQHITHCGEEVAILKPQKMICDLQEAHARCHV